MSKSKTVAEINSIYGCSRIFFEDIMFGFTAHAPHIYYRPKISHYIRIMDYEMVLWRERTYQINARFVIPNHSHMSRRYYPSKQCIIFASNICTISKMDLLCSLLNHRWSNQNSKRRTSFAMQSFSASYLPRQFLL